MKLLNKCVSQKDNSGCLVVLQVWDLLPEKILVKEINTQCGAGPRIGVESRE